MIKIHFNHINQYVLIMALSLLATTRPSFATVDSGDSTQQVKQPKQSRSRIKDMGGKILLDATVETTGPHQIDKYINFVNVSTPTATPASGHTFLFSSTTSAQLCAKFSDNSTGCLGAGIASTSSLSGITAGTGLTGGGTTGTVTVNADPLIVLFTSSATATYLSLSSAAATYPNKANVINNQSSLQSGAIFNVSSGTVSAATISTITFVNGLSLYASTTTWSTADGTPRPGQWFVDARGRLGIGTHPDLTNINEYFTIAASTTYSANPTAAALDATVWNQGDSSSRLVLYSGHGLNDGTRNAVTYLIQGGLGDTGLSTFTGGPTVDKTSSLVSQNVENLVIYQVTGSSMWFEGSTSTSIFKMVAGSVGVATFTASGASFTGTTTNDNASLGNYGEYLSSSASNASPISETGSNQWTDVASTAATAGDWEITGQICQTPNGSVTTEFIAGIGFVVGNTAPAGSYGDDKLDGLPGTSAADSCRTIANLRKAITSTTTFYLKGLSIYSAGTPKIYGRLSARRMR